MGQRSQLRGAERGGFLPRLLLCDPLGWRAGQATRATFELGPTGFPTVSAAEIEPAPVIKGLGRCGSASTTATAVGPSWVGDRWISPAKRLRQRIQTMRSRDANS